MDSSTTDEDTNGSNGSFEIVERMTDSADSEDKAFELIDGKENATNSADEEISKEVENLKDVDETMKSPVEKFDGQQDQDEQQKNDENEEWMDILGSGQLLKKVLKEGKDDTKPERYNMCIINYKCSVNGSVIKTENKKQIQIGDGEVVQGLDLALPLMNVGEVAEIQVAPRFGYGSISYEEFPPDATLLYTIELISAVPEIEIENMSVEMRSERGNKKKILGNWYFERNEIIFAIHCYKRALQYLDCTEKDVDNEKGSSNEDDSLIPDRIIVYNNLAAVQLKSGDIDGALQSADIVLQFEPDNVKAIFRKGKALLKKNELLDAIACFKKATKLNPDDTVLQKELAKCQYLLARQNVAERNLYKKMLGKPGISDDDGEPVNSSHANDDMFMRYIYGGLVIAALAIVMYYLIF